MVRLMDNLQYMSNKLVEISQQDWETLRDLYKTHKQFSSCYNLIQIFINWLNKEPTFPLKIYSLNGEWKSDGTFVAEFYKIIYCNTCGDSRERLLQALNCLDSSRYNSIAGFQEYLLPTIEQHFIDSGLIKDTTKFLPIGALWYHIPQDEALNFTIETPDNISFKPLEDCNAEQINNVWPDRAPGSIELIKLLIRFNTSVGVFAGNDLVAWCLIRPSGSLGALQVRDSHKRKGFGSLAARYMSKVLAERGIEVTAPVVFDNVASRAMFDKLGFKIVDKVYWVDKPAT